MNTEELVGPQLAWAVAKVEDLKGVMIQYGPPHKVLYIPKGKRTHFVYDPTTNWKQAGIIIDREVIGFEPFNRRRQDGGKEKVVRATIWPVCVFENYQSQMAAVTADGPDHLTAAMRVHVLNWVGRNVDLPKELSHG